MKLLMIVILTITASCYKNCYTTDSQPLDSMETLVK